MQRSGNRFCSSFNSIAKIASTKADIDWDWPGAEAEFRRAIALNPHYATTHHWFAVGVLGPLRRFDEALAEIQRAQELDPLSPAINVSAGEYLSLAGKSDMGIQVLQKQISSDPAFLRARIVLAGIYISTGKLPEAIAELETMRRLAGNEAYGVRLLGFAYARAGRTNEARAILGQLLELQRQGLDHRVDIAMVQHGLGDDESALDSLEQAVEEKASFPYMVNHKPVWSDLRLHPRAQAILKRMNLVK